MTGRYAAAVPLDGSNLILRARDALRELAGCATPRLSQSPSKRTCPSHPASAAGPATPPRLCGRCPALGLDLDAAELAGWPPARRRPADVPRRQTADCTRHRRANRPSCRIFRRWGWSWSIRASRSPRRVFAALPSATTRAAAVPAPLRIPHLRDWLEITRNDLSRRRCDRAGDPRANAALDKAEPASPACPAPARPASACSRPAMWRSARPAKSAAGGRLVRRRDTKAFHRRPSA